MGLRVDASKGNKVKSRTKSSSIDDLLKRDISFGRKPFSSKSKEALYTELQVLLTSGIRLKDALYLIGNSQKRQQYQELILGFSQDILNGEDFSEVIKKNKDFTPYEQFSLAIGEQTGTLAQVCTSLGVFYTRKNEQRRNIINSLTYPAIIMTTAILTVVFMLQFVVPMFEDVFKQNNVELPYLTKLVVQFSDWVGKYGWIIVVILVALVLLNSQLGKYKKLKALKDKILLKTPIVGQFIKISYIARFVQAVALLVSSKVGIPRSIELTKEMIDFVPLQKALSDTSDALLKGDSLSQGLESTSFFDSKLIALVRVAEETNQTAYVFERLNLQYNQELIQKSKQLSSLLEPLIVLFVGAIVGVILIAMYLPMFELGNVLK